MKIGIDCRFWGIEHAGLGRYTQNLVLNLLKLDKKNQYILFFRKGRGGEIKEDNQGPSLQYCEDGPCRKVEKVFFDIPHYSLKEQILFPKLIGSKDLDFCHFPHFNIPVFQRRIPFIVTIHDLIKHFFKGKTVTTRNILTYSIKHIGYHFVIKKAIKGAKTIIVPSHFVKDQVAVHYPGVEDKIKVTYEGVSWPYRASNLPISRQGQQSTINNQQLFQKYKIKKPYFIYVGNVYPFKNVPILFKALKRLNDLNHLTKNIYKCHIREAEYPQGGLRKDSLLTPQNAGLRENDRRTQDSKIQLVIVCARSVFWESLKRQVVKLGLQKNIIMPGQIPDEHLIGLYRQAVAFVTPSLMEGFGLPGLEALVSGCPVIAAKAGSLPEIYGSTATYFDPQNVDELVEKMGKMIEMNDRNRGNMIKKGKKQAEKYSWEETARETLEVYENI